VLVDWRPNAPGRWALAPYSLRATLPGPGVSAPVDWDDISAGAKGELEALHRGPQDVLSATEAGGDAGKGVVETIQELPSPG
jgi:DNA primase